LEATQGFTIVLCDLKRRWTRAVYGFCQGQSRLIEAKKSALQ